MIIEVEQALGVQLPEDLRNVYEAGDGRFNVDGQWWVIWPLVRVATEAPLAWDRGLPRSVLPFGDDGTGNPFCIDLKAPSSEVRRWNWLDGDFDTSEGDTINSFLQTWIEPFASPE